MKKNFAIISSLLCFVFIFYSCKKSTEKTLLLNDGKWMGYWLGKKNGADNLQTWEMIFTKTDAGGSGTMKFIGIPTSTHSFEWSYNKEQESFVIGIDSGMDYRFDVTSTRDDEIIMHMFTFQGTPFSGMPDTDEGMDLDLKKE